MCRFFPNFSYPALSFSQPANVCDVYMGSNTLDVFQCPPSLWQTRGRTDRETFYNNPTYPSSHEMLSSKCVTLFFFQNAPVGRPKAPVGKPKAPVGKPKAPVGEPKAPVGKPKSPVGEPKAPVGKPKAPVGKPKASVGEPKHQWGSRNHQWVSQNHQWVSQKH